MDSSDIYGGPSFDMPMTPVEFVKQPRVLLKIGLLLLSLVGLGCATNGLVEGGHYIYADDGNAGSFAVAVNLLGFLFSIASIYTDYIYDKTANIKRRRYILLADIAGAGFFDLLNFVEFCYLVHRWSNTHSSWLEKHGFESWQQRNARSVIFFAFVSFLAWGVLTFLALLRFRSANSQGLLSTGFVPTGAGVEGGGSAGIDDMYPPPPSAGSGGPQPPHQQQPIGGGGGVGAVSQPSSYYPPPTF